MAVVLLTGANFYQTIGTGVALVDFYATWCYPCTHQLAVTVELDEEMGDEVVFGKLDVDEDEDIATELGVVAMPTIIIFKNGQPVDFMLGVQSKSTLQTKLNYYLQ